MVSVASPVLAATPQEARRRAIAHLESTQNDDGSWGSGPTQPLATAETLLALVLSGRGETVVAQRAVRWLSTRSFEATDYRARALRALAAAGVDVRAEAAALLAESTTGRFTVVGEGFSAYDTALALSGIVLASPALLQNQTVLQGASNVINRRRADGGWAGDQVPVDADPRSGSSVIVTAEIFRSLAPFQPVTSPPLSLLLFGGFLAQMEIQVETLELASVLAAVNLYPTLPNGDPSVGVTAEFVERLLEDERLTGPGGVWSEDPFVNAMALNALSTRTDLTFDELAGFTDIDGDGVANAADAFPYDPRESRDLDGDGLGDVSDPDRDGDGVANGSDVFPDDPTRSDRLDASLGGAAGADDDGDGLTDLEELLRGTDATARDTDGDGVDDGVDPCPLVAGGEDADGDLVCTPADECDMDPTGVLDTDGDGTCDGRDPDADDDDFPNEIEIAAGSDPLDASSVPAMLAASGDADGDGLANGAEMTLGLSPFLADTDGDGALDFLEVQLASIGAAVDANDPALQPPAVLRVVSAFGPVTGSAQVSFAESSPPGLRGTATGGQPTPVASTLEPDPVGRGALQVNRAGFQPQILASDADGDALSGFAEIAQGTSLLNVDTDDDGFVDGPSGFVLKATYLDGIDLGADGGDGFVEGEGTLGTDPTSASDRPGRPYDVAPLGFPDGRLNAGDALVLLRFLQDPGVFALLQGDAATLAFEAADGNGDTEVNAADALRLLQEIQAAPTE